MGGSPEDLGSNPSVSLSPLQIQIARLVANELNGSDFALVGGAVLIEAGVVNRTTNDLDFFGSGSMLPSESAKRVEHRLRREMLAVEVVASSPRFARLEVSKGDQRTEVDFGVDARLFAIRHTSIGPTVALREVAVDKVLAIFGRTEPRDLVDFEQLVKSFPLEGLLADAARKDRGFDRTVFNQMLQRFSSVDRADFALDDDAYRLLFRRRDEISAEVLERSDSMGNEKDNS